MAIYKRSFLYLGILLTLFLLASNASAAETVILVNGKQVPAATVEGKKHYALSWAELTEYATENELLSRPAFARAHTLATPMSGQPFYFVFGQNDGRDWVRLYASDKSYTIRHDGTYDTTNGQPVADAEPVTAKPVAEPAPVMTKPATQPENKDPATHLWVVGRDVTADEKNRYKKLFASSYAQMMEHKESNAAQQEALENLQAEVMRQGLSERTFTVRWNTDSDGIAIKSSVAITVDGSAEALKPFPPPKDPEEDFEATEAPTLVALQELEASEEPSVELLSQIFRWAVRATDQELECTLNGNTMKFANEDVASIVGYAGLTTADSLGAKSSKEAVLRAAAELTRAERLALYTRRAKAGACLKPVFQQLWESVTSTRQNFVAWDFKQLMESIHADRAHLEYQADHYYLTENEDLKQRIENAKAIVFTLPRESFAKFLTQKTRDWLTLDTNSENAETRKEPIDILKFSIGHSKLGFIAEDTDLDSVGRGVVAGAGLQNLLNPGRYAPQIILAVSSPSHLESAGEKHYFVFCAGGAVRLDSRYQESVQEVNSWIQYFTFTERALREFRDRSEEPRFTCGNVSAQIKLPVEKLRVPLKAPTDGKFVVGEDRLVKAIFTFSLVDQVSDDFVTTMKRGISLQGYSVVKEDTVTDPKKDFLAEIQDADFYFPTNHGTDDSKFWIGSTSGRKFTLQKKTGDVTQQIVLFMPPNQGGTAVYLTDSEITDLFKKRRQLALQRRLTVMNIKCGSASCIPKWQRTYKNSLGGEMTPAQAASLPGEVPLFVGAKRSFASGSVSNYLSHAIYPFAAIDAATRENSVSELLRTLQSAKFEPVTNIDNPDYFSVEAQLRNVTLMVVTSTGDRLIK